MVNRDPETCTVSVKGTEQHRTYAYRWIKNDQIEKAREELNLSVESPVYSQSRWLTDERIMRAADLMVQSKGDEERAAIWLWVFSASLENAKLPYPNNLYIDYVGARARMYLQEHYDEWIFRYHHRFPHLFVDSEILSKVEFKRYSAIIDFAIMNAYMICKEYSIVLFDSEPEKNEPPFSYRNLRKE